MRIRFCQHGFAPARECGQAVSCDGRRTSPNGSLPYSNGWRRYCPDYPKQEAA